MQLSHGVSETTQQRVDQALRTHSASASLRQLRVGSTTHLDTILLTHSTTLARRSLGRSRMYFGRSGNMSPRENSPTTRSGSADAARADDDDGPAAPTTRACSCPSPGRASRARTASMAAAATASFLPDAIVVDPRSTLAFSRSIGAPS